MKLPVSVIIPTLNEEKYLFRLLTSLKQQTAQPSEIIIADNNSVDTTVTVARQFDCKVVKGGHVPTARNNGAAAAKEPLFIFFDADVIVPPQFLEKTVPEFQERGLDIASCYVTVQSRNPIDRTATYLINNYYKLTERIKPHAFGSCIFATKKIHEKLHGFDEDVFIGEDNDYIFRAKKAGAKAGLLTSEKIVFSLRRFEEEGRLKAGGKYMLMELLTLSSGGIKKKLFPFEFGNHVYREEDPLA